MRMVPLPVCPSVIWSDSVGGSSFASLRRLSSIRLAGYLESIRSVQPANRWKIMIVDEYVKTHIDHVLKMYDILDEGVQRASLPLEAMACHL